MNELPRSLKVVTVWLLVGLALFLAVQALLSQQQRMRFEAAGGEIIIRRGPDGHYHWPATVNGHAVDFLVDTGATRSALPAELARRLKLPVEGQARSQTAGGTVRGDLELQGGVRVRQLRITALPALGAPLLGMDVLGRLRWRQADGELIFDLGTAD